MWNIYAPCQPEHAIADDASEMQSKLAVESRAYPLAVFDPDAGETWQECLSLDGNPSPEQDWPSYNLEYLDDRGAKASMELPMTFADFALTEGRFRKHFRVAPQDTWNEHMVPIAEFIDIPQEDREGLFPYVWGVDKKNNLIRVICAEEMVKSVEERRSNWRVLKGLAGILSADEIEQLTPDQIAQQTRMEMAQKIASGLLSMATGGSAGDLAATIVEASAAPAAAGDASSGAPAADGDYQPVWVESSLCTSCDECIEISPKIFAYNDEKLAIVIDPKGGAYKDIVRCAEKCPAECIHPGTPWDSSEKGLDKLIQRAAKFQ
jgi:pyruvate-ferredoxin/flavodoxin oxidoreductase